MKNIDELIVESLRKKGGSASLTEIYSYVLDHRQEVRLNAKDNKKSIRGVLSKMKKANIVKQTGTKPSTTYTFA